MLRIRDYRLDRISLVDFLIANGTHLFQKDSTFHHLAGAEYLGSEIDAYATKGEVIFVVDDNKVVGLIAYRMRDWDTGHYGQRIASIDHLYVAKGDNRQRVFHLLLTNFEIWVASERIEFASIKAYHDSDLAKSLCGAGYYFIENEYVLSRSMADPVHIRRIADFGYRSGKSFDLEAFEAITVKSPWMGRFHSDSFFQKEKADEMYVRWLRTGSKKSNAEITVLVNAEKSSVGYILWTHELIAECGDLGGNVRVGDQELVALSPEYHGQGLGKMLYACTLQHMCDYGVKLVKTTISAGNARALNSQTQLGFRLNYPMVVFHKRF